MNRTSGTTIISHRYVVCKFQSFKAHDENGNPKDLIPEPSHLSSGPPYIASEVISVHLRNCPIIKVLQNPNNEQTEDGQDIEHIEPSYSVKVMLYTKRNEILTTHP